MKLKYTLMALAVTTCASQAALSLTDGDFEAGSGVSISTYFESATTGYNDYIDPSATNFSTNSTNKLFFEKNDVGYVYQQLGTYAGETTISLIGDSLIRDIRPGNNRDNTDVGTFTISFWSTDAGAAGADGTLLSSLAGASQLGSTTIDASALTYTGDTSAFSSGNIDISGATAGDLIWLQIAGSGTGANTAGGSQESTIDNLVLTAVPEPSSAALLGLGGLALILRRRK